MLSQLSQGLGPSVVTRVPKLPLPPRSVVSPIFMLQGPPIIPLHFWCNGKLPFRLSSKNNKFFHEFGLRVINKWRHANLCTNLVLFVPRTCVAKSILLRICKDKVSRLRFTMNYFRIFLFPQVFKEKVSDKISKSAVIAQEFLIQSWWVTGSTWGISTTFAVQWIPSFKHKRYCSELVEYTWSYLQTVKFGLHFGLDYDLC